MQKGQIVFCNLYLKTKKGKQITLKEVVFSQPYSNIRTELKVNDYNDVRTIHKTGLDEDLIIEKVDIIKELGFKHRNKGYTEAKANPLGERNIAGGYD